MPAKARVSAGLRFTSRLVSPAGRDGSPTACAIGCAGDSSAARATDSMTATNNGNRQAALTLRTAGLLLALEPSGCRAPPAIARPGRLDQLPETRDESLACMRRPSL